MNLIRKEDIKTIILQNINWNLLKGRTVLITGASGFIPSYAADVLLALGFVKVIAAVRNKQKAYEKFKDNLNNPNLKIIEQDVSAPFQIDEKIDYIIHAASQASPKYYGIDPVGTLKANTIGTYNLLELAKNKNVSKFLFISSGEIYGKIDENTPVINEKYTGNIDCSDIRSCYGESKRMGENMCVCFSKQYNIPVNIIRPSHIYGPGISLDDGRVFADFAKNVINGENIVLNSDGSAKRSFLYITDFISGLFRILFDGISPEAYNIASSKETSILELAQMLVSLFPEKNLKIEFKENIFKDGYIKSQSSRACYDTSKLKSLCWHEIIDIKEGFRRMIESCH